MTIPTSATVAVLTFFVDISPSESSDLQRDQLSVSVVREDEPIIRAVYTAEDGLQFSGYTRQLLDLTPWIGAINQREIPWGDPQRGGHRLSDRSSRSPLQ